MKHSRLQLLAFVFAAAAPVFSLAASDYYLQIKDAKGAARVVQCAGGVCLVDGLATGKYTVQACDAQGNLLPTTMNLVYGVSSPRDAATGLATGKRMHKPRMLLTMELGRSVAPAGAAPTNEIAIDETGVQLAIGQTAEAVDAALAKATKTRSNIQNN
jgi:hypothetical protein